MKSIKTLGPVFICALGYAATTVTAWRNRTGSTNWSEEWHTRKSSPIHGPSSSES
jgi:hypothetical protein